MPGQELDLEVEERLVLEKYEGDPADGVLLERIETLNGEIISREVFNHAAGEVD